MTERPGDNVEQKRRSPLSDSDPELYGYLCKLSTRIEGASGCGLMAVAVVLGAGLCWTAWTHFSLRWASLTSILVGVALAWNWVDDRLEERVFVDELPELERRVRAAGHSHDAIVGLLEGDESVEGVAKWLKKQPDWSSS